MFFLMNNNSIKKLSHYFLAFALILSVMFFLNHTNVSAVDSGEIKASKKIISVVYDDSGSMMKGRWAYANYAMQTLLAMINENDELYITFMSNPYSAVKIDTTNITSELEKIRNLSTTNSTPEEAIDTARKQLEEVEDKDISSQYWLVIMTDGLIGDGSDRELIKKKINSYKNNKMPNTSGLNIAYLAMGEMAVKLDSDISSGFYAYHAFDSKKIVECMREIANLVSRKIVVDDIMQIDEKTLSIKSSFPLLSMSVLSQESLAIVLSAERDSEVLNIDRNVKIDATNLPISTLDSGELYGNVSVINKINSDGNMGVIPAGTYIIKFSDKINLKDINFQIEPAIGLKVDVTRNGVLVDDLGQIENKDRISVSITPVIPGTNQEILDKDLPKDISFKIEYLVDGTINDLGEGRKLEDILIAFGNNEIRGSIEIPGFVPLINGVSFVVPEYVYKLSLEIERPDEVVYSRTELRNGLDFNNNNSVRFKIKNDGELLTKDEIEKMDIQLLIGEINCSSSEDEKILEKLGFAKAKCSLRLDDDGMYTLVVGAPMLLPIALLRTGDYAVNVWINKDESVKGYAEFSIMSKNLVSETGSIIINILVLIYLVYIIFIKTKFSGQVIHYEVWKLMSDGKGKKQPEYTDEKILYFFKGHVFFPKGPSYCDFHGLRLIACPEGGIEITGKSISKNSRYGSSSINPEKDLERIVNSLTKTKVDKKKREAADYSLSQTKFYFKLSEQSKTVSCIWMESK